MRRRLPDSCPGRTSGSGSTRVIRALYGSRLTRTGRLAPRPGTPPGRSLAGEVRLQGVEAALEDLGCEEPFPVVELVGSAVERRPPLDEAPVTVGHRRDPDRREVVLDALEGMLL